MWCCHVVTVYGEHQMLTSGGTRNQAPNRVCAWRYYTSSANTVRVIEPGVSVATFISQRSASSGVAQELDPFSRLILLISIYAEERDVTKSAESWLFRRLLSQAAGTRALQSEIGTQSMCQEQLSSILDELASGADPGYDLFAPSKLTNQTGSPCQVSAQILYHLLSILRRVPLRTIYAISGWQTTASRTETAKKEFVSWVHSHPERARKCLWHSSMIIAALRHEDTIGFFHPLALLIAVLFLWEFLREIDPGPDPFQVVGSATPLRLDRLLDESQVEHWVREGDTSAFCITGMGILSGRGSANRVLKEFHRILLGQKSWLGLSRGIAYTTTQHLQGLPPTFTPE